MLKNKDYSLKEDLKQGFYVSVFIILFFIIVFPFAFLMGYKRDFYCVDDCIFFSDTEQFYLSLFMLFPFLIYLFFGFFMKLVICLQNEIDFEELKKKLKPDFKILIILFFVGLPFYLLGFDNYYYATKNNFNYNNFFSLKENSIDFENLDFIEKSVIYCNSCRKNKVKYKYVLFFKNGENFNLREYNKKYMRFSEIAELNKILKEKNIFIKYSKFDGKAFIYIDKNWNKKSKENFQSIFSDFNESLLIK